jgi:hypothetical protein
MMQDQVSIAKLQGTVRILDRGNVRILPPLMIRTFGAHCHKQTPQS